MGRSLKKGPFVDAKLYAKVVKMNETNNKSVIKTFVTIAEPLCGVNFKMV